MASSTLKFRVGDMERITFALKVTRPVRFRMWLGLKLVVLGVLVTGMNVKVEREG